MTGCWECPQRLFLSTFLELVQTGLMDVRHDTSPKLPPCSELRGIPNQGILCGAGRKRQRSGERVCIHHWAKPPGSTEKELLAGLPQVVEVGLQKLLIFVANNLNYFGGKMVPKYSLVFFLNYILELSFICIKYFLSKRQKILFVPNNYSYILLSKILEFIFLMFHFIITTFKYVFVWMWFPNC